MKASDINYVISQGSLVLCLRLSPRLPVPVTSLTLFKAAFRSSDITDHFTSLPTTQCPTLTGHYKTVISADTIMRCHMKKWHKYLLAELLREQQRRQRTPPSMKMPGLQLNSFPTTLSSTLRSILISKVSATTNSKTLATLESQNFGLAVDPGPRGIPVDHEAGPGKIHYQYPANPPQYLVLLQTYRPIRHH